MTRPAKNKILVVTDTIAGKFVDIASRTDGYALVWDQTGDQYIHSAVLTTASVTFETLNTNGDVGTGADQLAVGNHGHTTDQVTEVTDKNYVTDAQLQAIDDISSTSSSVFTITLPAAGTIQERINLAVEGVDYPTGWILTADTKNIDITHNLSKNIATATVFNFTGATTRQLALGAAAYTGLYDYNGNSIKIQSLYSQPDKIAINLIFN